MGGARTAPYGGRSRPGGVAGHIREILRERLAVPGLEFSCQFLDGLGRESAISWEFISLVPPREGFCVLPSLPAQSAAKKNKCPS